MRTKVWLTTLLLVLSAVGGLAGASQADPGPKTGFEERNGASWTTFEEEQKFLAAVDARSDRVEIDVIGSTKRKRPVQLVRIGSTHPLPAAAVANGSSILFVCSQHGNEPAGREACLQTLRDMAFATKGPLAEALEKTSVLFIPAANPDGREANSRGNSDGTDINRDHLSLRTPEAQAIAEVVRDYRPDVVLDLHEYGPSLPVVYDDDMLLLWPRNLNVDPDVHEQAKILVNDYLAPDSEAAGYSADEYGQYEVADHDIHQAAGDGDEGIARNALGLRHSIAILSESAVTPHPLNGPQEMVDNAALNRRRVDSHMVVVASALRFISEKNSTIERVTEQAFRDAVAEGRTGSRPVYFDGADNDEPSVVADPPPCGYELSAEQLDQVALALRLHDIKAKPQRGGAFVSMAQSAEPVIPLLLDERGSRSSVSAKPLEKC